MSRKDISWPTASCSPLKIIAFMQRFLVLFFICSVGLLTAQERPAYRIFDASGNPVDYMEMLQALQKADVVCFGELHNNAIAHWLQLSLAKDLFSERGQDLVIGAEMFEADDQLLLDEYFAGAISTNNFLEEAKLWDNYATDYEPVLEFARRHGLRFVATNVPRRYASWVFNNGLEQLESLSAAAKGYLPPLPVPYDADLPGYQKMLDMMGGHGSDDQAEYFPQAQAIKDATMAYRIAQNWEDGKLFFHLNGSYHSDNYEGIVWYLDQYLDDPDVRTISTVEQTDLDALDKQYRDVAHFIIAIPADMTKTYRAQGFNG